jgi:hypothetical protein
MLSADFLEVVTLVSPYPVNVNRRTAGSGSPYCGSGDVGIGVLLYARESWRNVKQVITLLPSLLASEGTGDSYSAGAERRFAPVKRMVSRPCRWVENFGVLVSVVDTQVLELVVSCVTTEDCGGIVDVGVTQCEVNGCTEDPTGTCCDDSLGTFQAL